MAMPLTRARGMAIGRLRVAGADEPLQLRLGIERLLSSSDLVGTHLPPAAILVVRRFVDPLPGQFRARAALLDPRWQQSVREAVDRLADGAARPTDGEVDPAAPAVLFADRSELLYCATFDLLTRGALLSWWWRDLRLHSLTDVVAEMIVEPGVVPAMISRLDRRALAAVLAREIESAQAADLVRSTAQLFGVSAIAKAALEGWPNSRISRLTSTGRATGRGGASLSDARMTGIGVGSSLTREQGALIAIAVGLASSAGHDLRAVVEARHRALVPVTLMADSSVSEGNRAAIDRMRGGPGRPEPRVTTPDQTCLVFSGPGDGTEPAADPDPLIGDAGEPSDRGDRPRGRRAVGPAMGFSTTDDETKGTPRFEAFEGSGVADPTAGRSASTTLGGLFHLVYVAQVLGLYGDFTSTARPGIPLNVWDFVTLVGHELGAGRPRDPVWRLLAELAGLGIRDLAGTGYRPPRVWRVPPSWLCSLDASGTWHCRADSGRAQLVHPAGFLVVDGPGVDLVRELRRYGAHDAVVDSDRSSRAEPVRRIARERWVGNIAAYLRVRLGVAMDLPPARAPRALVRRPALVEVTSTRVDVTSSLADLSVSVRLAGLDRDAGFVPAAGRSLWFHFS